MTDRYDFDGGPAQLWTARPNGALDWVSGTTLTYFGRTMEQMIDWGWADVVHPDDLATVGERWGESLETGKPYRVRFRLKRADGAWIDHVGRATAVRNDAGAIERWVGANLRIDDLDEAYH